jgi:hypothetical protein
MKPVTLTRRTVTLRGIVWREELAAELRHLGLDPSAAELESLEILQPGGSPAVPHLAVPIGIGSAGARTLQRATGGGWVDFRKGGVGVPRQSGAPSHEYKIQGRKK